MGDVFQAARATDPVGHGWGMVGLLAGVVVGAAIVAAGVVTGGAAIALVIAAGALSGAALANGIQKVIGSKNPTTGHLGIGSLNVKINGLGAARVMLDFASPICNGLYGVNHFAFLPIPPIAEGNPTIRINGMLAARVKHELICAADITDGSPTVWYGAASEQVLPIINTEKILTIAAAIVVGIATIEISGPLLGAAYLTGGFAFSEGVNYLADKYLGPGWGDIINGTLGFLALGLGAYKGRTPEELLSRRDNYAYSSEGRNPGSRKSYIDDDGNLNPANKDGNATPNQYVRGSEPAKSNSPYTSFSEKGTGSPKNYDDGEITVDKGKLQWDINSGKVKDVEIIENKDLLKMHDEAIAKAQERYDANPSPKNLERLERAQADKQNSIRDNEVLIKGVIPKEYIKTKPSH